MGREKIYPFAVARIRMLENSLLTEKTYTQLIESKSAMEVFKILSDAGYGGESSIDVKNYEKALSNRLAKAYSDVKELVPKEHFPDVFLLKNDYQNLKVLVKSDISSINGENYLVGGTTIDIKDMKEAFETKNYGCLTENMAQAITESYEQYAKSQSGQAIDNVMDNAAFKDMLKVAKESGIKFVENYVKSLCDITNLKSYNRIKNMKKTFSDFESVFVHGGTVSLDTFKKAFNADGASGGFKETAYNDLALKMDEGFTVFEKSCDDYLMAFMRDAKYKSLTVEPLLAFIYAVETEVKTVRIIVNGKLNGIDTEVIKERLRDAYV